MSGAEHMTFGERGKRTLTVDDLFPAEGHRYFTDDRIEELRQVALAAGDGDVSITAYTVIQLICDWRNMDAIGGELLTCASYTPGHVTEDIVRRAQETFHG